MPPRQEKGSACPDMKKGSDPLFYLVTEDAREGHAPRVFEL
jgi:hypothetical protein